jgi:hypothetical protein
MWYGYNGIQRFVNEDGTVAKNYQYLNDVPQLVLCIPADAMEEDHGEVVRS